MFTVLDVIPAVERALGTCDQDTLLERINRAVEILCTESDWDPTRGFVDITVDTERCLTLPDEVETILAINLGGRPSQGHDVWFQFHLNGPGSGCQTDCRETCNFDWFDKGQFSTITDPDPATPFAVAVSTINTADHGKVLRVFGYDSAGNWITTVEGGVTVDGFLVPTDGSNIPNPDAPLLTRITRVQKDLTGYALGFSVYADGAATTLLGYYRPYETEPQYRRVRLTKGCTWARVAYKRRFFNLVRTSDLIPLHSQQAVVMMTQALKKFDEDRIEEGQKYWETAVRLLMKKQHSISPPTGPSIQMADRNLIADKTDRLE